MSDKPYFAPETKNVLDRTSPAPRQEWDEDAKAIAEQLGLGSYGGTTDSLKAVFIEHHLMTMNRFAELRRGQAVIIVMLVLATALVLALAVWR
jgi:hypothetical protein